MISLYRLARRLVTMSMMIKLTPLLGHHELGRHPLAQLVRDASRPPGVERFPGVTLVQGCVKVIQQRHEDASHGDRRPITQVPRQGLACQELWPSDGGRNPRGVGVS